MAHVPLFAFAAPAAPAIAEEPVFTFTPKPDPDLPPAAPRTGFRIFSAAGDYKGHLQEKVVFGAPSGLTVDNSGGSNQGRVCVTSGNTHEAGVYAHLANYIQ